jgi:hypothetical protein
MLLRAVIEKANLDLTGFKDHYEASHYALELLANDAELDKSHELE